MYVTYGPGTISTTLIGVSAEVLHARCMLPFGNRQLKCGISSMTIRDVCRANRALTAAALSVKSVTDMTLASASARSANSVPRMHALLSIMQDLPAALSH